MRGWHSGLLAGAVAAIAGGCVATGGGSRAAQQALAELVGDEKLVGGRVGVFVQDLATGEVLARHAADRGFATASNMKLVSAAVALHTLRPKARTHTDLFGYGRLDGDVWRGDLVLSGHGDPTLPWTALGEFAAAVEQAGVRRVTGRVRGDGSWLGKEQRGHGWQWDYLDRSYAAPFGGLCLNQNCVNVTISPGRVVPRVLVVPRLPEPPEVLVEQVSAGQETAVVATRAPGDPRIVVRGTIAADSDPVTVRVAVHDPARFAAAALTQRLRDAGIAVDERPGDADTPVGIRVLVSRDSPTWAEIVEPLLRDSNNLYAEVAWRASAVAASRGKDSGGARRHTVACLQHMGVDTTGMVVADGSGLSRRNLVQPRQLAELLRWVNGCEFRDTFFESLPIAGRTGTLRNRFQGAESLACGRVRAKTGFISRVVCLSGYVPRPDPAAPPLAFVVMVNDFTCPTRAAKAAVDTFVEELAAIAGWREPAPVAPE